jgi:hypothetical protein
MEKFHSMYDLFKKDREAKKYFDSLPDYVREQIARGRITSNPLQACATIGKSASGDD